MSTPEKHPEHDEALLLRDAMIAGLAGAAGDLSESAKSLYRASVLSRTQRFALFAALFLIVLLCGGLLVVALQNRSNGAQIRDCTEPGGKCAQRGQQQTADAIAQLVLYDQAAAYCSPRTTTQVTFRSCVADYVSQNTPKAK